jgi:uncharacterized protein (TIGR00730 family)
LGSTFVDAARATGREIASAGLGIVYGGGNVGIMGELASAAFEAGGEVVGVVPRDLVTEEIANFDLTDLLVVPTMHDRKALMIEMADGFIALPGGFGTLEEFFEAVTWAQLGIHKKPCGLLNVDGYFDNMLNFLDHSAETEFIHKKHRAMVYVDEEIGTLIKKFQTHKPPKVSKAKWVKGLSVGGTSK